MGFTKPAKKCVSCEGVFHPATGHAFSEHFQICGPCAREFCDWYKKRMNQMDAKTKKNPYSFSEAASKSIIGE